MPAFVNVLTLAKGTKVTFNYNGKDRLAAFEESQMGKTGHVVKMLTTEGWRNFEQSKMLDVKLVK